MEKKNYQFTQVPTNLFILLDNNCRSMLFTLIQLSSYYADEDGWFFRRWEDLIVESNMSINLSLATVQTLFNHHIIEAKPTGYGKGRKPNYYKVNFDNFAKYDEITIEDAMKNPDLKIRTVPYKGSNFKLNLVRETVVETVTNTVKNTVTNTVKSENNIDNIDNVYNIDNLKNIYNKEYNIEIENNNIIEENDLKEKVIKLSKITTFEEFKEEVDIIFNKVSTETEAINEKGIIQGVLSKIRLQLPQTLFNRCSMYINRRFQEKIEELEYEYTTSTVENGM